MHEGKVGKLGFVSSKGYGIVRFEDGTTAFAPTEIVKEGNVQQGQEVIVQVCDGHLGPRISGMWRKVEA